MTKTLTSLADLKEIQLEERQEEVAAEAQQGINAVIIHLDTIKLEDRVAENQALLNSRDNFYIAEGELTSAIKKLSELKAEFEKIPRIIELRKIFRQQKDQAFGKDRPAGNGRVIPIVHKDSELAQKYRADYAELKVAEEIYRNNALVEVENEIDRLRIYLKKADTRNAEQPDWDKKQAK